MQSIATYSEVRFEGSRTFTLLPEKIVVRGSQSLQAEFESSFALVTLDPNPDTLRFRNHSFTMGMWIAIAGFVACSTLVSGFHMSFAAFPPVLTACIFMGG